MCDVIIDDNLNISHIFLDLPPMPHFHINTLQLLIYKIKYIMIFISPYTCIHLCVNMYANKDL